MHGFQNLSIITLLYLIFQAAGCVTELALRVANKDLKVCDVGEIPSLQKIWFSPFYEIKIIFLKLSILLQFLAITFIKGL